MPYIGNKETVASLDRNSFFDYGMYRRKKTDNLVEDVTIRNEYTTVNAIAKFAYGFALRRKVSQWSQFTHARTLGNPKQPKL